MNLLENEVQVQKNKKAKIIMIIMAIAIVILIIISIVLAVQIGNIENSTLKLVINGKNMTFDSSIFRVENNQIYIKIRDFAELIGYTTYSGEYKTRYTEDSTKCHIVNGTDVTTSDEVASFVLNSSTIYKLVQSQSNKKTYDYEYFEMEGPVISIDNELYAPMDGLATGTNSLISYSQSNNTITVQTLDYIVTAISAKIENAAYNVEEDDMLFNNKKALKNGLVVVISADGHYGVTDTNNKEIIGTKYASIEYSEGSGEFTVTTDEGLMGIISVDGTNKIDPNYTEIKQISKDLNYYLVKVNEKYGVINQNGNTVIFSEYDQIGIDESNFTSNHIDNPYVLFDYCIPVKQGNYWGVFNIEGDLVIPVEYTEMGCVGGAGRGVNNYNNVVIIPQYEALVMGDSEDYYAIISKEGAVYVQAVLDGVYSVTTSGVDTYYMTFTMQTEDENGKVQDTQITYDIDVYFEEQEIIETTPLPELVTNSTATNEEETGEGTDEDTGEETVTEE